MKTAQIRCGIIQTSDPHPQKPTRQKLRVKLSHLQPQSWIKSINYLQNSIYLFDFKRNYLLARYLHIQKQNSKGLIGEIIMTTSFIQDFENSFADLPLDFKSFAKKLRSIDSDSVNKAEAQQQMLLRTALIAVRAAEREIARQQARIHTLESLSVTDETTGLLNRRGFQREMTRALSGSKRRSGQGILVICDLDGFKAINDTHGHAAGDEVLLQVAELLHQYVRKTDSVARIGGDEFAILMLDASVELANQRAQELQNAINSLLVRWQDSSIRVQASFGVSVIDPAMDAATLYQAADSAMYQHKKDRKRIPA
jgi:diguanylate cyclase (GGDEF)-like protein